MEAVQEKNQEQAAPMSGPTAKEMAAAEELNAARAKQLSDKVQTEADAKGEEPVSIIGLAAQGREVLLEQLRQHADRTKPKEYTPPPRTARQMEQLQAEMEAGQRAQARAQAQFDSRPQPAADRNEGFTTPVYRPNDAVPDPVTGKLGTFGAEVK